MYRRHTLFSSESVEQIFQSSADFGRKAQCPITRSGDLLSNVWLQVTLPSLNDFYWGTLQTATATKPAVLTARWTSSSTARATFAPPTQELAPTPEATTAYRAILSPANLNSETSFSVPAGQTYVDIDGLVPGTTYTVSIRRDQIENDVVTNAPSEEETDVHVSDPLNIDSLRWTNSIGHALLRHVELEIGGVKIDRHESDFMDIMSELSMPEEKRAGFEDMIGKYPAYDLYDNSFAEGRTLYIPLQFFFCKTPALAIPIVSIVYHNVVLNFEFRSYIELVRSTAQFTTLSHVTTGGAPSMDCRLYATFVLLDTQERTRFSTQPGEYLVEQCQFLGDKPIIVDANNPNLNIKAEMNFSHPVKEIIWVYNYANTYNANITTEEYPVYGNDYFNYNLPDSNEDPFVDGKIQINGHDRTQSMPAKYWRCVQPYQHHTRIPSKKIFLLSFALQAESPQPSGTCNFSRVDTSHLVLNLNPSMLSTATKGRLRIFATSFNLFRVAQGLSGLAFAGS